MVNNYGIAMTVEKIHLTKDLIDKWIIIHLLWRRYIEKVLETKATPLEVDSIYDYNSCEVGKHITISFDNVDITIFNLLENLSICHEKFHRCAGDLVNKIICDCNHDYEIYNNDIIHILDRPHVKFIDTFNELITEYNISNHNAKLIKIWFNKNQKKLLPIKQYTTRYGRITKSY